MILLVVLLLELVFLFFSSKYLVQLISILAMRITRSKKITIYILSLLFFPGVVVHELAHALTAAVLFVPVGNIEFVPQMREKSVKLGSVAIEKTDPIRRFLIGVAPFVIGLAVIYTVLTWYVSSPFDFAFEQVWKTLAVMYVAFQVSNTMFSSKKDMEGALFLFVAFFAIVVALLVLQVQLPLGVLETLVQQNTEALKSIVFVFLIPVVINMGVIFLMRLGIRK